MIGIIGTVIYLAMIAVYVHFTLKKARANPDAPEYYALDAESVDLSTGKIPPAWMSLIPLARRAHLHQPH